MSISTKFMGMELSSPIIVGSCGLSTTMTGLEKMHKAGAGAVVLKSIFEEQILFNIKKHTSSYTTPYDTFGDSYDYIANHIEANDIEKYLNLIREAKKSFPMPIIGSINCSNFGNWINYAKHLQEAGCDAIELNLFYIPFNVNTSHDDIQRLFSDTIQALRRIVTIPLIIKTGNYFTDLAKFMQQLSWTGISAITLFNRATNWDIDTETRQIVHGPVTSSPNDFFLPLRWTAILSKKLRCEISASGGVQTGNDVIKLLLAGASTVQVVSSLYNNGIEHIATMNNELSQWMERNNYKSISNFRGSMAIKSNEDASQFERIHFMKYFSEIN
ncbi:MAG: dihydroorotate dehydrogenase-like protein [Bacteroidales bacterium]|nr:dihydroorotate dehydrogenase-like protein [Bacteroidales bacterium]